MSSSEMDLNEVYTEDYVKELEEVIIDLLDGDSKWYDIQYNTGLSEQRCKEISKMFYSILNKEK